MNKWYVFILLAVLSAAVYIALVIRQSGSSSSGTEVINFDPVPVVTTKMLKRLNTTVPYTVHQRHPHTNFECFVLPQEISGLKIAFCWFGVPRYEQVVIEKEAFTVLEHELHALPVSAR